ncbi:ankyrin repeat domain-containing 29, partial, partial [Paramuricea clavata]
DGATPLFVASQNGRTEVVLCLLNCGASINKCRKDKTSPLWIACQMGHSNVVKLLLYAGASVDQCREDGSTPLFKACHKGHVRVVDHLLNHHIKPELGLLKNGQSALHGACLFGHLNIVKLLVEAGGQVDIRNQDGYLPSDLAELGQYNDILSYFSSLNQLYSTAV